MFESVKILELILMYFVHGSHTRYLYILQYTTLPEIDVAPTTAIHSILTIHNTQLTALVLNIQGRKIAADPDKNTGDIREQHIELTQFTYDPSQMTLATRPCTHATLCTKTIRKGILF